MTNKAGFDLIVVGAGIVGLGVALAAVRKGKRVAVIERNAKAIGASIRNFGFVTVSGQKSGEHWARARRTRDIWAEIADEADIEIIHRGAIMVAHRQEAKDVLDAFLATSMGSECRGLTRAEALTQVPSLRAEGMLGAIYSPYELRIESKDAIAKLSAWLAAKHGVVFHWSTVVTGISGDRVETSRGPLRAKATVVCPGDDFTTLYPERIAPFSLKVCTLQMLRLVPAKPVHLSAAVVSDLSIGRFEGFADLPGAHTLSKRLEEELPEMRASGVHVIAVQSADGSLVVGDSHVYSDTPEAFSDDRTDNLILKAFDALFDIPDRLIAERWMGSYASATDRAVLIEKPADNIRIAIVTGGTGASTGFALGEQVVSDLFV